MRSIMAVKKKYIIVAGCVAAIVILAVLNVWSVYSDKDDVGGSWLQKDGKTVVFYNFCTIKNVSFFPKKVTIKVYSYRDAAMGDGENTYITSPELIVESIEIWDRATEGMETKAIIMGNTFVMEPLSSYNVIIHSTGEYGGYGNGERHPADTIKLSSRFIIGK